MLILYNTLRRRKEKFEPIEPGRVRMYSCGPTVYGNAHIGNLRTYLFMDLLRRTLKIDGYAVLGVMNITDVGHLLSDADTGEDKMQKAAREARKTPWEIAEFYASRFFRDIDALNVSRPEIFAKATDNIPEMIEFVKALQAKGYAYETSDGVYFDISAFPSYGKLSGQSVEEKSAGARIEPNAEKRNPADFALWKKADATHIMRWPSPWGLGFPGWHIECSAMGLKYLGFPFDIHTGGIDAVPIHHENEIAQNEALFGAQTVNFWMHGEFMTVNGGKMSKSLGNAYTLADLAERDYSALDFRYFCLNAHYRKRLNFTFAGMDSAKRSRANLVALLAEHRRSDAPTDPRLVERFSAEFSSAMNDDLNAPKALGALFGMLKQKRSRDIWDAALRFDEILGLKLGETPVPPEPREPISAPPEVSALLARRAAAKSSRDFATADALRAEILELGYAVIDTPTGPELKKKD